MGACVLSVGLNQKNDSYMRADRGSKELKVPRSKLAFI